MQAALFSPQSLIRSISQPNSTPIRTHAECLWFHPTNRAIGREPARLATTVLLVVRFAKWLNAPFCDRSRSH
jgi:hypothetical protein